MADLEDVNAARQALLRELHTMGVTEVPVALLSDIPFCAMISAVDAGRKSREDERMGRHI